MSNSKWCAEHIFSQHRTKSIMTKLYFYEIYVFENLFSNLPKLYGHRLGCFCAPGQPCHVDVLLRLLYESLEDSSGFLNKSTTVDVQNEKENNDEQTAAVATTSLSTPNTGKMNKLVFRKKSKSVTTQTQNQEKANISSTLDFTTEFLSLQI